MEVLRSLSAVFRNTFRPIERGRKVLHRFTAVPIALFAAGVLSTSALAQTNPIIDWSGPEAQAYEPGFVMPFNSQNGAELTIVGKVLLFQNPLGGNNATDPSKEYTFVFDQLISNGIEVDGGVTWNVAYSGGRFRVFEDLTPNRVYTATPPNVNVPSTFTDFDGGSLILQASVTNFLTKSNKFAQGGNYNADIAFNGGSQLSFVNCGGGHATLLGVWNRTGIVAAGYIRSADGEINLVCPVPTEPSTWGNIKALYRN